ncbi:MAG: hypothetical protein R3B40_26425 [Polyangiales bacterium]
MNRTSPSRSLPLVLTALSAALVVLGCGDDGDSPVDMGMGPVDTGMTPDTGTPPDAGPPPPQFIVHSAVQTTDGRSNYFSVVNSVATAQTLDYADSLEIPGRARLYAAEGIGFFAIGDSEDVSITRYELSDAGEFVEGDSISLQSYGVSTMGAQAVLFVSATKAYYKDPAQAQIIVWNPTAMTITDSIDLPAELIVADWSLGFGDWILRGTDAFLPARWTTATYDRVRPGSALIHLDTTNDEVTVTNDARCRGLSRSGELNGDLYFFSEVITAFGYAVYGTDGGQQDCILRVNAGTTVFDASYLGSVNALFDADELGAVMALTDEGEAWIHVVDTSVAPTAPGTTYSEWYATGWTWMHVDFATLTGATRVDRPAGAYSSFTLTAEGHFFISQAEPDYSMTTLLDLTSGEPVAALAFPGFVLDVAQAR